MYEPSPLKFPCYKWCIRCSSVPWVWKRREYSVPFAEVYVHKSKLFRALSPGLSKYPISSDFHHTNHALIL